MATHYAVRSVRNLLLALVVIGSLTTACKKSGGGTDVDPRDQYVGKYEGGFQVGINLGGIDLKPESGTAVVTVTKASNAGEIYLETVYNSSYTEKVTAELKGATFTVIDRTKDVITVNTTQIQGDYSATGVFDKNQVAINATTEARTAGGVVRRTGAVTGTKK
jgi:hypothetical protein